MNEKESLILEATPRDEWVRASEIADKTGLTTQVVGTIIGYNLLQYIERKRLTDRGKIYVYKRINWHSHPHREGKRMTA